MARGDDRYQPELHAAGKPPYPKMAEVQEELRKLWEVVAKLEGRLGTITLRDNLYVMGSIGSTASATAPALSTTGTGQIYLDPTSGKYLVSEGGSAYVELAPSARARVTHSAAQTIPDATPTTLAFDTETFDTDNMHDNAVTNSRLTFHTAGTYEIGCEALWDVPGGPALLEATLRLNGTTAISSDIRFTDAQSITTAPNTLYAMSVDDYVEVVVTQTSGGPLDVLTGPLAWTVKLMG